MTEPPRTLRDALGHDGDCTVWVAEPATPTTPPTMRLDPSRPCSCGSTPAPAAVPPLRPANVNTPVIEPARPDKARLEAALAPVVAPVIVPPFVLPPPPALGDPQAVIPYFVTRLAATPVGKTWDGRTIWRLTEPLVFVSRVLALAGFDPRLEVPAGFETDFATAWRLPLIYFFAGGQANHAACLHDYLYGAKLFRRAICDAVMNEAMRMHQPSLGIWAVSTWRRVVIVGSIRAIGGWVWARIVVERSP